jgi:hypothetical protein
MHSPTPTSPPNKQGSEGGKEVPVKAELFISEEDIQQALVKFKTEGGLIKKLPDEVALRPLVIGRKYGTFEILFDGNFGLDDGYSAS